MLGEVEITKTASKFSIIDRDTAAVSDGLNIVEAKVVGWGRGHG